MSKFFISYNSNDRDWATWIAWQLEEGGHPVVIQDWDFVGNWIVQMDAAMRTTDRTIAVLSPHYLSALYTLPEWADAFRRDPTGTKDLLITIRVRECEPQGLLAQIVYTDLVMQREDVARDLLLKRVSGRRGKPDVAPSYPGSAPLPASDRQVPHRPAYPAADEDLLRLQRFRVIARDWHERYATRIDALRHATNKADVLRQSPPDVVTPDLELVVSQAMEIAEDLARLPVESLAFAQPYGLKLHPAVFGGQAITIARSAVKDLRRWKKFSGGDSVAERRRFLGPRAAPLRAYDLENLRRLFDSAIALALFDADRLPKGFLDPEQPSPPADLRHYRSLLIAETGDSRLRLYDLSTSDDPIGVFAARELPLGVLAARVSRSGSLDMVATDSQHLFYWEASSALPVQQVEIREALRAGAFVSCESGAIAVVVGASGVIFEFGPDGKGREFVAAIPSRQLTAACVRPHVGDPALWSVHILGAQGELSSMQAGDAIVQRGPDELWVHTALEPPSKELGPLWSYGVGSLFEGTLNGRPCLLVVRGSQWGPAICFLDPATLDSIRSPMRLSRRPAYPNGFALAGERWMLGTCTNQEPAPSHKLLVWDLDEEARIPPRPVGAFMSIVGDSLDPVILESDGVRFRAAIATDEQLASPSPDPHYGLWIFEWPEGRSRIVARFKHLALRPVAMPKR